MLKRILLAAVLIVSASVSIRAQEAAFVPLQIGTEWRMARSASGGPIRIVTYSVVREETSNGRIYSVVRADESEGWLVRDTAALARIVRAGEVIDRFDPDWNDWQWPLAIGKTWVSEFRRTAQGVDLGLARARWTVAALEEIAVPAGRFRAYRIERTPLDNTVHKATRWYAPAIGLMVKQISSQTDRPGEVVEELVSYKK